MIMTMMTFGGCDGVGDGGGRCLTYPDVEDICGS